MKKSLITSVAALAVGLFAFAETNMIVKLNNGENVKFDVENAGGATLNITLNETLVESFDIEQELNDNAK